MIVKAQCSDDDDDDNDDDNNDDDDDDRHKMRPVRIIATRW